MNCALRPGSVWIVCLLCGLRLAAQDESRPSAVPVNAAIVQQAVTDGERVWRAVQAGPAANLASRDLFTYALALCEARAHPERLERLFAVAEQMQERRSDQRGFGNFRWSWGNREVIDFNAVDFCLQAGAILWLRHRETLPAAVRASLGRLLEYGAEGLRRHRVNESYTNIALMNAGNLLLLGEAMGRAELAAEGASRLERVVLYTAEAGVHEYASPTYYGVDLDDLLVIDTFTTNPRVRAQARALQELLWSDIALNWFGPAAKLGGARSRDYDYLRGLGVLDQQLQANGWIAPPRPTNTIYLAYLARPVAPIRALTEKFPRLVTQTWGFERGQTRTHYLCDDVTLSSAGAGYGGKMDLPLTVDLPGPRERVRGYFIPDGRHDPYGKTKIAESAAHSKTLHLQPYWAAAQRQGDALGLVVYRAKDVPDGTRTLESHFVLPIDVDEIWIGGERVRWVPGQAAAHPVAAGAAVVIRSGTALVGVRVPWTRNELGAPAEVKLVCDAVGYGAMRLTVEHHVGPAPLKADALPGAAWWVRIGSHITTAEAATAWRDAFARSAAEVNVSAARMELRVAGQDGRVGLMARAPFQADAFAEPVTPRQVLGCDGDDIGARILATVEPVRSLRTSREPPAAVNVPRRGTVLWEAESAAIVPPMTAAADAAASGGRFAWMPAQPGERASSAMARARYTLKVSGAGERYLWGRVISPTPENDSFFVTLTGPGDVGLEPTAWPLGVHRAWTWVRFAPDPKTTPALVLPEGESVLEIRVREAGAKLDRLYMTDDPRAEPPW